jgi:5S rRNA maturation endonuclease (ribonuclease M5)
MYDDHHYDDEDEDEDEDDGGMMMIMRMMMVVRMMIMVMTIRIVFAVMVMMTMVVAVMMMMMVAVMVIMIMMRRKRRLIMMIYYYSSLHVSIIFGVVFKKSDSLYGIDLAADGITKSDAAVIVEGYFDVISMHDMGISNVVAALGTAVTINQLVLAASFSKSRRVILLMDGDAAGIQALEQIKNRVEKHRLKDRSTDGILLLTTSIASIRGFIEAEQLIPRISSSSSSTASSSSSSEDQLKVDYYDEIMTHLKDCSDVHMWFSRPDAFRIMQHVLSEATTLL